MRDVTVTSLSGSQKKLDAAALADLKSHVRGQVVTANDATYDSAREIWNAMIDRKPGLIVQCSEANDVVQCVKFARKHELLVSVRGAGHNIAGKSLQDGALLIDLSPMRSVQVDAGARTALAGPGATLADVDAATAAHGLVVPTGINSTTGIAGLTLGGGFGWLSRSLGLTIDSLVEAEIVTANGDKVTCDEKNHADLFWSTRGGGGNFGIVTAFRFKLHALGAQVMCGPIVFPHSEGKTVLRNYREFCKKAPDALTVWAVLRGAPPLPFLDASVHGKPVVILVACYNGSVEDGTKAIEPLKKLGKPIADGFGPAPFAAFQQAFDPLLTPGMRNYWKSHNFKELKDDLLDKVLEYSAKLPSPHSEIFLAQVGGKTNTVASDATAYPHRDVAFVMNVHTRWEKPADDKHCIDWARDFYQATEPFSTGGVYVNFISEGEDRVQGAYGANYARLAHVKAQYDPDNFFRVNQNITPSK